MLESEIGNAPLVLFGKVFKACEKKFCKTKVDGCSTKLMCQVNKGL